MMGNDLVKLVKKVTFPGFADVQPEVLSSKIVSRMTSPSYASVLSHIVRILIEVCRLAPLRV